MGKVENADNQQFLLFPQGFQKAFTSGSLTLYEMTKFQPCSNNSICRRQINSFPDDKF